MDSNGVKLSGVVKARGAFGARVVWSDSTLYVLQTDDPKGKDPLNITAAVFRGVEQPKRWGGGWKARIGDGSLMMQRPSCGCKKAKNLAALSVDQIVAMGADEEVA